MAFTLEHFTTLRPRLYHLTARENVDRIRRTRRLVSANILIGASEEKPSVREKRGGMLPISIDGELVVIRDQLPLHEGNMLLERGWSFGQFVKDLNQRVFFWAGKDEGPNDYGLRHFQKYRDEDPVIVRVGTRALLDANPGRQPLFCKYNSGSPRCTGGRGSPRGPNTFMTAPAASFRASEAVEVTYLNEVKLPRDEVETMQLSARTWTRMA